MRKLLLFLLPLFLIISCTESRQNQLIEQGDNRSLEGKYAESAEYYRKAAGLNPESKAGIKAMYKLGYVSESYLKDFPTAILNYVEFIRLSQEPVSVYEVQKRLANIYFDHNQDNEKAIAAYKKLLLLSPDSLESDLFQFRIAQSYFRMNNFEQARIEYDQLLASHPKSEHVPRTRFEVGNSYYMEGKYDTAQEALKQVIRNHPQHEFAIEAEYLLAQCLEQQSKLKEALQGYENLLGKYPSKQIIELRIDALKKRIKKEK